MTAEPDGAGRRYEGAAPHYATGRLPYPEGLADVLQRTLGLDGSGRLLDVGCGPGSVILRLAGRFEHAVGLDTDADMIAAARAAATAAGVTNVRWLEASATVLADPEQPGELGRFRLVTFAQSFHWLDRPRVAAAVRDLLEPGGACAFIYAWSLSGDPVEGSPDPVPPYDAMNELVQRHLDRVGSSGRGLTARVQPHDEADVMQAAGFVGPEVLTVPGGAVVTSSIEDVISRSLSVSRSSPGAFGAGLAAFVDQARALVSAATPTGRFAERVRDTLVTLWRPAT